MECIPSARVERASTSYQSSPARSALGLLGAIGLALASGCGLLAMPSDRFRLGDLAALNDVQRMELRVFAGKGRCTSCPVGANLTDE